MNKYKVCNMQIILRRYHVQIHNQNSLYNIMFIYQSIN